VRGAGLACILGLAATAVSSQEMPVFSTSVEMVRLDVSAIENGIPIKGLRAQDFVVLDNGVRQKVTLVGVEEQPVHAVLALDSSSSVAGARLARLKAAAHAFVNVLRPEDHVSLLTFSDRVRLRVSPDESRERAHEAIDATVAERATALTDAVFVALTLADPSRGRPLVLVFTDGEDVGSWLKEDRVLAVAASSELVAHVVVSSRKGTKIAFLEELCATTGGQAWRTGDEDLGDALLRALDEFRSRYTLQYALQGTERAGWRSIEVKSLRRDVKIRARKGYLRAGPRL